MHFDANRTLSRLAVRAFTMLWTVGTIPSVAADQVITDAPAPPPQAEGRFCADQEAFFSARMAFIEAKVELRVEQRAQWDAFVAESRDAEKPLWDFCGTPPPPRSGDALAALEARDRRETVHENAHKSMRDAVARLKASLAIEQQRRLAEALLAPPFAMRSPGFGPPPPPGFMAHAGALERCGHPAGPPGP